MSGQDKKRGRVEVVAKTGGIKFKGEDKWYNPTKEAKNSVRPEFRGKEVEIELSDPSKNIFNKIEESKLASASSAYPRDAYTEQQQLIVRQTCLKAAAEIVCAELQKETLSAPVESRLFALATQMEDWVWQEG